MAQIQSTDLISSAGDVEESLEFHEEVFHRCNIELKLRIHIAHYEIYWNLLFLK